MKNKILLVLSCIAFAGCVSTQIAVGITAVSEIAASNAIQQSAITVPQLSTLATDLNTFANNPSVPLPSADAGLVANLVTQMVAHKNANLTQESVVDASNKAISALSASASTSPTAWQGIAWADMKDIIAGLNQAVVNAQSNPSLVPQK